MDPRVIRSTRNLRAVLAAHREYSEKEEAVSCTRENLEDSLSMLSEELEALGIEPVLASNDELESVESLKDLTAKLVDSSWRLVHKHRSLMRKHDQLNDIHSKISNDNTNLKNRVDRLREDLKKKQNTLEQGLERERRLKTRCESVSRELKLEKEETLKLKKQSRSKDSQHEHELRRIMQNGYKLRAQLQKSIGTYSPKDKDSEKVRTDRDEQLNVYKDTIRRLEENNRLMMEEIGELKDTLALHTAGIELHVEASGIWTDTET